MYLRTRLILSHDCHGNNIKPACGLFGDVLSHVTHCSYKSEILSHDCHGNNIKPACGLFGFMLSTHCLRTSLIRSRGCRETAAVDECIYLVSLNLQPGI